MGSITGLEKAMATHSSTLAWKIPWTGELGMVQSMGSRRGGHLDTTEATQQQQQQKTEGNISLLKQSNNPNELIKETKNVTQLSMVFKKITHIPTRNDFSILLSPHILPLECSKATLHFFVS